MDSKVSEDCATLPLKFHGSRLLVTEAPSFVFGTTSFVLTSCTVCFCLSQ